MPPEMFDTTDHVCTQESAIKEIMVDVKKIGACLMGTLENPEGMAQKVQTMWNERNERIETGRQAKRGAINTLVAHAITAIFSSAAVIAVLKLVLPHG